jgi:hydrogenase-4 component B
MMAALAYLVAAGLGLASAGVGVAGMTGWRWSLGFPTLMPLGGLAFHVDPVAGFFLAVLGVIAVPTSVYAVGYARGVPRGAAAYLAFVGAMAFVPLAANVLTFLLAWELMTLASYALVLHPRADRDSLAAAWVYAVMTHAGLVCLTAGMLLVGQATGSLAFVDWRAAAAALPPAVKNLAFVLLALGFATKAGVVPLHVWLPRAHPAAPSPVSALMSGVMIKLGVYGLVRVGLDWLGVGPAWWGGAVLLGGAVSAIVGVLYALVDHDLKRLLAFHSIENVGIILIGLGAGMLFHRAGLPGLAVLAVLAALYHTANHAAFKALLFLAAGAVVRGSGTRNMEEMGGLARRMPWTAASFLVGAAAISGLPPLNGFVSEWLTFQALLQNLSIAEPAVNLVFTLGLAGLALTAGLAMACFVKAYGITFLAMPRSRAAEQAQEATPTMRAGMALLAIGCIALGIGATAVVPFLAATAGSLTGAAAVPALGNRLTLEVSDGFASLSPVIVAAALAVALLALFVVSRAAGGSRRYRRGTTWGCGRMLQTARMEYTATAFANPFKRVFDFFYRPEKQLEIAVHPGSRLFVEKLAYENPTRSVFEEWLYRPALAVLHEATGRVRAIQSGSANLYLAYILVALLLMLVLR